MPELVTSVKPLEPGAVRKLGLALSGGGFRTACSASGRCCGWPSSAC